MALGGCPGGGGGTGRVPPLCSTGQQQIDAAPLSKVSAEPQTAGLQRAPVSIISTFQEDKHIMPSSLLPLPSTLLGEAWSRGTRRTNERRRQVRHRPRLGLAATSNGAKGPDAAGCMHG